MCEYDIYIPGAQSDGAPVSRTVVDQIQVSLINAFGGFTQLRPLSEREWRIGGVTFRGEVTIFRVLDEGANGFDMVQFKRNLESVLKQEKVLILERTVEVVDG